MTTRKSQPDSGKPEAASAKSTRAKTRKPANQETLNHKQQRFIDEYLVDLNATQAAIRAGYSPKTAGSQAFDLLKKPEIQQAIEEARQKTANKLEITRERVLEEYAKLAFLDPRRFYNEDGTLKKVPDMDADTAAALQGFEVDEIKMGEDSPAIGVTQKIKWHDKKAALDSIARMMGWNQDKVKLQGDPENPLVALLTQVGGTSLPVKKDAE
ncbi:MAG TPA: terminase small subunit [Fluviicoccus sp.]|nr:terminase small subunit [Fluviicoccus sp.]